MCIGNQQSRLTISRVEKVSDLFLAASTRKVRACSALLMSDQLAILDSVCYPEGDILLLATEAQRNFLGGCHCVREMLSTYSITVNNRGHRVASMTPRRLNWPLALRHCLPRCQEGGVVDPYVKQAKNKWKVPRIIIN